MFCPKCGEKLADDSRFCSACGAELTVEDVEVLTGQSADTDSAASASVAAASAKKPGSVVKKVVVIVAAVAVILAAVLIVKNLIPESGDGNAYAYLSDGRYELITNLKNDKTIEFASSKSDNAMSNLLAFSPDGKYIYFYTKYDTSNGTGSLCRAEYGKLKADSSKNEKYIEDIASNVSLGFRFLDDGTVLYMNGAGTLCWYNGSEVTQVAKNVSIYYTDGSKKVAYETGDYSDGYTLYGVSLDDIDNKIAMASNYSYVLNAEDPENIQYVMYDEENGESSLYVTGFSKESQKLGDNIGSLIRFNGKTYFSAVNGTTLNLYDYVEDLQADADAEIAEPAEEDFYIPAYNYELITEDEASEDNYRDVELYTSCSRSVYWYNENDTSPYSMFEFMDDPWEDNSNTDAVCDMTQQFIDKYSDMEDENGCILVTDEVKAALQNINKAYADSPDWEWLWFCFTREEDGTTVDYDAYNAAYDKWYEATDRIEMREALQNKENAYRLRTLYCFDKGNLSAVNETVLSSMVCNDAIIFNTTDMDFDAIPLEDVSSVYDVYDLLSVSNSAENYVLLANGTTCRMSAEAASAVGEANEDDNYATLYFTDSEAYMNSGDGTLYCAEISGGTVGAFSMVADGASVIAVKDGILYYAGGSYQSNDLTYCDLYSYSKGTEKRLARDILRDSICLYEDGAVLAYTNTGSHTGYELTMFDKNGEGVLIGDNIKQYIRVNDSLLLYISDGSLYSYDGKEKKLVRSGADWFWSLNSMKISNRLGWYDYEY